MAQIPIQCSEILNLTSAHLSIPLENIKFGSCSMESDKFITVCETGQSQIAIVDLSAGSAVSRQKISTDAAIMNPLSNVIALKVGQVLQIFNIKLRAKMKSYNMPAPVTFWRWVSPNIIALVTATSVFHWFIEGESAPVKIFDRHPALSDGNQIINYQVSGDGKWCLMCGISAGATPGVINGNMQLYSMEKRVSQMLQGHTGVFTDINIPDRDKPVLVLIFEDKKPDQPAKLFIREVGGDKTAPGGVFGVTPQIIPFAHDAPNDFLITMHASKTHGMVYMISKMGSLFLFDLFSGQPVYRARITMDTVFSATEHSASASGGILAITRQGLVLAISLNETALVPHILHQLWDQQLAIKIASRQSLNLPSGDDLPNTPQCHNHCHSLDAAESHSGIPTLIPIRNHMFTPSQSPSTSMAVPTPTATSWLAVRLLQNGIDVDLVKACDAKLVKAEGFALESDFAQLPAGKFTSAYLTRIGISARGLQLRLIALHREIQAQHSAVSPPAPPDTTALQVQLEALKLQLQQQHLESTTLLQTQLKTLKLQNHLESMAALQAQLEALKLQNQQLLLMSTSSLQV